MNCCAISWELKRQKVTALSSAESEFYAASACGCEIMYLRSVMQSLGFKQDGLTPVAKNNVACIYMSKLSMMFNKGKHIDVQVYRLCEFVQDGVMELYHVSTTEQVADMFTKALPSETLKKHHQVLAGADNVTVKLPGAQVGTPGITKLKSSIVGSGATDYDSAGGAYVDTVSQD
eukprot:2479514-Rhodomonas_salina.1